MRINIILPGFADSPIGGFKVQYEYANRLARAGHRVTIHHGLSPKRFFSFRGLASFAVRNLRSRRDVTWFRLDRSIDCRAVPYLRPSLIKRADITILTSYLTSEAVSRTTPRTGPLVQIVYDFEVWATGPPGIRRRVQTALQRADVHHIATSQAVEDMLRSIGVTPIATIQCGLTLPDPETRLPPTIERKPIVGFALRDGAHRGLTEMIEAMEIVRRNEPEVTFECFGAGSTELLPPHVVAHGYVRDDELMEFYRRCMIFVSASYAEGFGLPAAEAMANGAAVVVAENGGSADFAFHDDTAIVVPPRDGPAIADAVLALVKDEDTRAKITSRGIELSTAMGWSKPAAQLMATLEDLVG